MSSRRRRRWATAAVAGALLLVLSARSARAQEAPPASTTTTTTTSAPGYEPTVGPDVPELDPFEAAILNQLTGTEDVPNPCADTTGDAPPAGTSSIVPDDCWGRFPSSHYDIGCDEGAWNHISRKVYCTFTDLAFQGARSSTAMALWLVDWAYGFGVYDQLGGSAVSLAETYETNLIGPIGLGHVAWFYAVAWCALAAMRGRLAMAAGELLTSVVLAILAGVLLSNPAGYLEGTFETMGTVSGALLATGTGEAPPHDGMEADAVLDPLQAQIHRAFVEDPYDYLDWGGTNMPPQCVAMRDRILATGPHGNSDTPREAMQAVGCDAQVDFNHEPNGSRLFGAVFTFGAALVMVVLIALVALTIVVAQVVLVILFALLPFAALAAVLPGAGRELAWRWLAALLRVVLAVIGMGFVLSLLLLTIRSLLEASTDVGLVERFALVNMVVVAAFVARRRIIAAGHGMATTVGQRLSSRRAGGERVAPWLAAPAVAGATGFALGASIGPDRASRTSRFAGAAGRNHLANRRMRQQTRAADQRAERRVNSVVSRERTDIQLDGDGNPIRRSSVSIDGPAATSRRARAARERLEQHAGARFAANQAGRVHRAGWHDSARAGDSNLQADNSSDTHPPPPSSRHSSWSSPPSSVAVDDAEPIDVEES